MPRKIFSKILSYFPQIFALLFLAGFAVFAWQEPTGTPPTPNVDTPLNVGSDDQIKTGGLWLNSLAVNTSAAILGNLGIGTTTPSQKLDVVGNVKGTGLCIGSDCRTIWPAGGGGGGNQTFTLSGTFTVPAGVTEVLVTIIGGGGGGGGGASGQNVGFSNPGGTGGNGGASSFGSYVTAAGGSGGGRGYYTGGGAGGASGGSGGLNGASGNSSTVFSVGGNGGNGGSNTFGSIGGCGGGSTGCGVVGGNGTGYGAGGGGGRGGNGGATPGGGGGGGGGSGNVIRNYSVTSLTPGSVIPVTVGPGVGGGVGGADTSGLGYTQGYSGGGGINGYVFIEWSGSGGGGFSWNNSCQRVSQSCSYDGYGPADCLATCPAGYAVTGGGCNMPGGYGLEWSWSYPSVDSQSWLCARVAWASISDSISAHAICCQR